MKDGQLYHQALPDAVTLYWCKPENAPAQAKYDIFGTAAKWALSVIHTLPWSI